MNDSTTKLQFVELRAKGKSFVKISEELGVSKTTLIDWSKGLAEEISNLKTIELEALKEEYKISCQQRIILMGEQLELIRKELLSRKLDDVSTDKLFDMLFKISDTLNKEDVQPIFAKTTLGCLSNDYETTEKWSA